MSCQQTKKSLSDYLDDRLSSEAAQEVETHLADCTACRAELADLRRIDELMGGFADPPVDEERLTSLWSRVESQLDAEPAGGDEAAAAAFAAGTPIVMSPRPAQQPRWIVPTLAAAGVAVVAVFVIALVLVLNPAQQPPKRSQHARNTAAMTAMGSDRAGDTMAGGDTDAMQAMDAMGADVMTPNPMTAMGADAMTADPMTAMGSDMGSDTMAATSKRRRRRRGSYTTSRSMGSSTRRTMSSGSSSMTTRKATMARSMGSSSLQDLLRRAGGSMGSMSSSSAGSNLPARLSMSRIRKGVYRILGSARACYSRYKVKGRLRVRVVIVGSTGRVKSATILGTLKGTPTGRCVARAFKRARFDRFRNTSQSFVFPLVLR